jgi:hypothetical protein
MVMHDIKYIVGSSRYSKYYLDPPVLGSMGLRGHRAAPMVRPSSLSRLYVDAALRLSISAYLKHIEIKDAHRVHHVQLDTQAAHIISDLFWCGYNCLPSTKQQDLLFVSTVLHIVSALSRTGPGDNRFKDLEPFLGPTRPCRIYTS